MNAGGESRPHRRCYTGICMRWCLCLAAFLCGVARSETSLVLPFFNLSHNASLDWIGESIAEAVTDALSSQNLLVLDREDRLEGYRRLALRPGAELTHASILKLGEALDAARVVYGSYQVIPPEAGMPQTKGTLRITARIL